MNQDISKIHYEVLDHKRLKLFNSLAPLLVQSFVLSGGTALALQIKHRKSFDFDFFCDKEISSNLIGKLKNLIKISTLLVNTRDELSFMTPDDIKVSLIYYPFFKFKDDKFVELQNGIKLFTINEISAQKAYAIGRRGTYRDYYDLYSILKDSYLTLKEIIEISQKIYSSVFNPKLFLEQLVYFEDLTNFEIIPIDESLKTPDFKDVKLFLEKEVKNFLKDLELKNREHDPTSTN